MNTIVIKGRLTQDPELRQTNGSGTSVCTVNVAVNRPYSKENEVDFFTVVFWRQTAEFVAKYFTKGQEIIVQGEMQSRKYVDRDGNNRIAWELKADRVEFCGSKGSGGSDNETAEPDLARPASKGKGKTAKPDVPPDPLAGDSDEEEKDLPF